MTATSEPGPDAGTSAAESPSSARHAPTVGRRPNVDGVVRTVTPTSASAAELAARKDGLTISVCLPARNEQDTVGPIVSAIAEQLVGVGLVDELLLFDDGSSDETAAIAAAAGATVIPVSSVLPEEGLGKGKGNVLYRTVAASTGDVIVWCDTDLTSFTPSYVTRLVAPLIEDDTVDMVKGYYERPVDERGQGGGRTTELVARPLFSLFFPPLASIRQPLGGECAARRRLLERLPFIESYGVESQLLIDTMRLVGIERIAQVDLGIRQHRHRTLVQLSDQAAEIMSVVITRAGLALPDPLPPLINVDGEIRPIQVRERRPMVVTPGYRRA